MFRNLLIFNLLLLIQSVYGQPRDHAWLITDNISVRITPTGIHADSTGGILFKRPNAAPINLLSHLSPWVGGHDPAGNLKLSCEMSDLGLSDWKPGILGITTVPSVWRITYEQIQAHLADFRDNGFIDNPIPEIFAWPAMGNPHSISLNGFEASPNYSESANFYDTDADGIYLPENGDFPITTLMAHTFVEFPPDQIIFTCFFADSIAHLTKAKTIPQMVTLHAVTFDCSGHPFMENAVFMEYTYSYYEVERMDSTYFGLYADFDIGNPYDDYLGCVDGNFSYIYAYNADTTMDVQAGLNPPMVNLRLIKGPMDTFGNEVLFKHCMPIIPDHPFWGLNAPSNFYQFYNYLSGSWRDGAPLTYGGSGYGGTQVTNLPYTGIPSNASTWSEFSAQNTPGDRKVVASFQPVTILPKNVNSVMFSLSVSDNKWPVKQLAEFKEFGEYQYIVTNTFHHGNTIIDELCFNEVSTQYLDNTRISLSPNPASSNFLVTTSNSVFEEAKLFDLTGRLVAASLSDGETSAQISFNTAHLPSGLYLLHWKLKNGRMGTEKLVVIDTWPGE
jgi:hypothetical protein